MMPAINHLKLLIRVIWDFVQGMYAFHFIGPCVTVFGSARLTRDGPEYRVARTVGMALGANGFTVMTGGGPGLMEAASRGAQEAGGRCVACRIRLSLEQERNNYIDRSVTFRYFFVRKVMLVSHSRALIVLPGGLGTLDELFEVLTLIQTRKIDPLPIIFVGKEYWQPVLNVIERMAEAGTISQAEMERITGLMLVTDNVQDMIAYLKAKTGLRDVSLPSMISASPDRHSKSHRRLVSVPRQNSTSTQEVMAKFRFKFADLDDMPLLLDMKAAYHASENIPFDHELERDSLLQLVSDPEKGAVLLIHYNGHDVGYCILLFGDDPFLGRNAIMDELYCRYSLDSPDLMNSIRHIAAQICREHGIGVFHEKFGHQYYHYLKTTWLA